MGVCHGPCSLAGCSRLPALGDGIPRPCLACAALSGERHTLQTLKTGGFNQWLPTKENPQRNSGSEPSKATVWENEVGGIPRHNVTFSRLYRDEGQWKTTHSFVFNNLLTSPSSPTAHTLIAERNAEAAQEASSASDDRSRIWTPPVKWAQLSHILFPKILSAS